MESRRAFIKYKVLGSLIGVTGLPLLQINNTLSASKNQKMPFLADKAYEEINWEEIRAQFLFDENKYFFNTATIGPSPNIVIDSVCDSLRDLATRARDGAWLLKDLHLKMARFLNTTPDELAITRNCTEGMNIVARSLPLKSGDEVLITDQEHIGGSAPWIALQKDKGVVVKIVKLEDSAEKNLKRIEEKLTTKTKVVSFSHITCTNGIKLPAKEIIDLCRIKGIYSCVDGAQAAGMIPVDLKDLNPDFYACGGHKWLMGPKGTGLLFINNSVIEDCSPVFVGAYSDSNFDLTTLTLEYRKTAQREEYGTRNVPLIVGLGSAVDFIDSIGIKNVQQRGKELQTYLREQLESIQDIEVLTPNGEDFSNSILTFRFKEIDSREVVEQLRLNHRIKLRYVYENKMNGIRASLSVFILKKDIDYLVKSLKEVVSK